MPKRHRQEGQHRQRHLARLDLAAKVFRRAPDHQPGQEHGQHDVEEHPVKPRADAAEDHLADLHEDQHHQARQRHEAVMHRVDRPVRRGRGRGRPERRQHRAEALLLAFHVRAEPKRRVARDLVDMDHRKPRHEHHRHRGKDRPALPPVPGHPAEEEAEGDRDQQDRQDLRHVRGDGRVLERMGRVHAEEAAAVGAKLLDRDLRRGGAAGDDLLAAPRRPSRRPRPAASAARPAHARNSASTTDSGSRIHRTDRVRSTQKLPSVAALRRGKAPDHRHGHGHPGARADEVLHRQPGHLAAGSSAAPRPNRPASWCW